MEKRINTISDMEQFARSPARERLLLAINSICQHVTGFEIPEIGYKCESPECLQIVDLLTKFSELVDKINPLETTQRFGNLRFRDWFDEMSKLIDFKNEELTFYLSNSFGSRQRIDYGTGHELNFLAFVDGIFRNTTIKITGPDILFVFSQYFNLCRKFILKYNLEPAGSHGVWGLDDHFHLPFIFGAAQLSQLGPSEHPKPSELIDQKYVREFKDKNLYFGAIAFILNVKSGPFFEHSPVLYDITGVRSMLKIKQGMIKMYIGEVLTKFPIMQHFYFGELFKFD